MNKKRTEYKIKEDDLKKMLIFFKKETIINTTKQNDFNQHRNNPK